MVFKPRTNPYMELRMHGNCMERIVQQARITIHQCAGTLYNQSELTCSVTRLSTEWVGTFEGNAGHPPPGLWLLRLHVCFEGLSAHTLHKPSCATIVMMARLHL